MPITLDYFDERPAWKLDLAQPESFREVELRLRVRLFRLPTGVMLSTWLRLYDLPDQPYSIHRVLDLSDGPCRRWLDAAARMRVLELMFPGYRRTLSIEELAIGELCELGQIHLDKLAAPDGAAALRRFLDLFNASMKERFDIAHAWDHVADSLRAPSPGAARLEGPPLVERARARLKQGDWELADGDLQQLLALAPGDGWATHQRALVDLRLVARKTTWTAPRLGQALGALVGSAIEARKALVGTIAVERRELGWAVMVIGLFALTRAFVDGGRADRAVVSAMIAKVVGAGELDDFLEKTLPVIEWLGRESQDTGASVAEALLVHVARDLAGDAHVRDALGDVYIDLYRAGADVLGAANPTRDDDVG